ncbi:MFS transporter [Candidimonas nitroreducens]|uniref:MFS transporter n=2 Tax=Candidimonas nitroreducens TaxID=683354 RepID=A0A225MFV4_9BURK|nr:MFS transporter [Candidimonas nitroreducens]
MSPRAVHQSLRNALRGYLNTNLLTHGQRQYCIMVTLALAVSVEFLENIMFVFSAGHIMGGIDADPRGFALAQSAYAIGSMLMIVKQQWLARRYGYRRYLAASLLVFSLGTWYAAASTSLSMLVTARLVQGVGGGALFTSSRVLIPLMFAPADRGRAVRLFMLGIFGVSAIGPALSAELIDNGAWQHVFYGVLPLSLLAMAGSWLFLPDAEPSEKPGRPALIPLLWFGAAIAALQIAMSDARFDVFSHPGRLLAIALCGIAMLLGFLWHQWHQDAPLLKLRVLRNPVYLTGLLLYFMYYLLSHLHGYVFPIYAERALQIPLTTVGWLSTIGGLVSLVSIMAYIRYAPRLKRKKPLMILGLLIMAYAAWRFSAMPPDAGVESLIPILALKGLFGVMVVIPVAGLTFRGLGEDNFAHGYQSKNLMRQIASSFASALGAVLLENRQFSVQVSLAGAAAQEPAIAMQWLHHIQDALMARGMDAAQAGSSALAQLTALLDRQALLIASEDMFRLIAALAIGGAVLVLAQRRLA